MTNFLNYIQDRLDQNISKVMKGEQLTTFNKHPFEEYNKCKKVDFERTQKDFELFFDF